MRRPFWIDEAGADRSCLRTTVDAGSRHGGAAADAHRVTRPFGGSFDRLLAHPTKDQLGTVVPHPRRRSTSMLQPCTKARSDSADRSSHGPMRQRVRRTSSTKSVTRTISAETRRPPAKAAAGPIRGKLREHVGCAERVGSQSGGQVARRVYADREVATMHSVGSMEACPGLSHVVNPGIPPGGCMVRSLS